MLDPQERHLLLNALRPPEGFELTFAIGTTYTLDLMALLTAPLGFTLYELAGPPGAELRPEDATRLLTVLRRYADRITIFCEAGRINVPAKNAILLGQLEGSVVEVRPPEGGSFHPKVWALRFHNGYNEVRYRILCLTRNLTFDRSWDTLASIDGELIDRKLGFGDSKPLGDFFSALPRMAVRPELPGDAAANVAKAAEELRRVRFDPPEPFDRISFHPLGLPGYPRFKPLEAYRTLAVAPFLGDTTLKEIAGSADEAILVSRVDQLDLIDPLTLSEYAAVKAFDPGAALEPSGAEEASHDPMGTCGLHAKLYVQDVQGGSVVFTGSANATPAGFRKNVEFMLGLWGKTSKCGVDAVLASPPPGRVGLESLLRPYVSPDEPAAVDEVSELLEDRLEAAQCAIASAAWTARVEGEEAPFTVTLSGHIELGSDALTLRVRPILLPSTAAVRVDTDVSDVTVAFSPIAFETLTAFYAFEVALVGHPEVPPREFVMKAQLLGEPAGRRERIAQYLLRDREQVVRFLLSLLADGPEATGGSLEIGAQAPERGTENGRVGAGSDALLEPLLRALDRDPERIDEVAMIIDDLKKTEEGRAKLPPDIDAVWSPIWQVRGALKAEGRK